MTQQFFPDIITKLPRPDIPLAGLTAHLLQGEKQQIVFMSFDSDTVVPSHSHAAQWGVVLAGEIELIIEGTSLYLSKGDTYCIPENTTHSAFIKAGYKDLSLFDQQDRYTPMDSD